MRKKTFFLLLFLSFYMVGLQEKKIENRFFQIARFLGGVPLKHPRVFYKNNNQAKQLSCLILLNFAKFCLILLNLA
jgi:hypothetical protein